MAQEAEEEASKFKQKAAAQARREAHAIVATARKQAAAIVEDVPRDRVSTAIPPRHQEADAKRQAELVNDGVQMEGCGTEAASALVDYHRRRMQILMRSPGGC